MTNALLDILARKRRTYLANLRQQSGLRWQVLGDMCSFPNKEQYRLKEWDEAVSYLIGCAIHFKSYEQIEKELKPFVQEVR